MNVIHITGTKGKGSTSAFTESLLRQHTPEWKIGAGIFGSKELCFDEKSYD
jgi:folylpolyglutamate synthase/dihydropteroate synthase